VPNLLTPQTQDCQRAVEYRRPSRLPSTKSEGASPYVRERPLTDRFDVRETDPSQPERADRWTNEGPTGARPNRSRPMTS
jgi:hypothetical protein